MQSVSVLKRLQLLVLAACFSILNPAIASTGSPEADERHPHAGLSEAGKPAGGARLPYEIDASAMQLVPLVVSFDRLEKMGELTSGWGCWTHIEQVWTATEKWNDFTKMMDQRLRARMGEAGFSLPQDPSDIFGETADTSRFKLGGTIDSIHLDICTPGGSFKTKTKGSASLKITWKIYSKAEQKVVAELEVQTSHTEAKAIPSEIFTIFFAAFDKAIDALFASPQFQAAAKP